MFQLTNQLSYLLLRVALSAVCILFQIVPTYALDPVATVTDPAGGALNTDFNDSINGVGRVPHSYRSVNLFYQ